MSADASVAELDPELEDQLDEEKYSVSCLILGESGSGKTSSIRNLDPETTVLVQPLKKALPFKNSEWRPMKNGHGNIVQTDDSETICKVIKGAYGNGKKVVVIDDFQYTMCNEFMRKADETGWEKFTQIGVKAWDIMVAASEAGSGVIVYILSHVSNETGTVKAKTIGKMLDEKVVVEGMFPIVMRCLMNEGQHYFTTKSNGKDTVKTPIGMFAAEAIDNDLALVDQTIREYYSL